MTSFPEPPSDEEVPKQNGSTANLEETDIEQIKGMAHGQTDEDDDPTGGWKDAK